MSQQTVQLEKKQAKGHVIPIGSVNLVMVITDSGMVGCGAFDVMALDNFNYPAACVKPPQGKTSVATVDDLLQGEIKKVNAHAEQRGITLGMSGREALN